MRPCSQSACRKRWGELVGAAKEGLLALSVGVGLGVLEELMAEEVDDVVGPRGSGTPSGPRTGTGARTARSRSAAASRVRRPGFDEDAEARCREDL